MVFAFGVTVLELWYKRDEADLPLNGIIRDWLALGVFLVDV